MPEIFIKASDEANMKRDNKAMGFLVDDMEIDEEYYENESTYVGSEFKATPAIS